MDIFNRRKVKNLQCEMKALTKEALNRQVLVDRNRELAQTNAELTRKLDDAILKIRKQTEADIYLVCKKIVNDIEEGDKLPQLQPQIDFLHRLQDQLAQQQLVSLSSLERLAQGWGTAGSKFVRF